MFQIKKIRPLFTGIVTTAKTFVGPVTTESGLLLDTTKMEGSMNPYQWVVEVGDMVKNIKPGEIVRINFKRYLKAKHVPGVIEDNIQSDNLSATYEIPMVRVNGQDYLFIQNNDIEFVVSDYDGIDEGGLLQ